MDMHAAALPPRSGIVLPADRKHPLFPLYEQHRSSCQRLMIDCSDFRDWLSCYERERERDNAAQHPRYPEFVQWMRDTRAGGRKCQPTSDLPHGLAFPHNFLFWLEGGRW